MSETRKREHVAAVRLNDQENRTIEKLAKGEGITVAEAMRRLILKSSRGDVQGAGGTKRGA
jgi:DNA-directed RNA polymerase alpha subunit